MNQTTVEKHEYDEHGRIKNIRRYDERENLVYKKTYNYDNNIQEYSEDFHKYDEHNNLVYGEYTSTYIGGGGQRIWAKSHYDENNIEVCREYSDGYVLTYARDTTEDVCHVTFIHRDENGNILEAVQTEYEGTCCNNPTMSP